MLDYIRKTYHRLMNLDENSTDGEYVSLMMTLAVAAMATIVIVVAWQMMWG